jgi:hypothetical protein
MKTKKTCIEVAGRRTFRTLASRQQSGWFQYKTDMALDNFSQYWRWETTGKNITTSKFFVGHK